MPELRAIPLDLLDPPDKPMRIDTTFEGLSDLKESLAQNGLINPVTARQAGERYQLIAGVRRSLAARELGWKTIEARVYAEGEPCNVDEIMAHENFHRTQINAVEEALYHAEQIAKHGISVAEEARRSRRSPDTVRHLLELLAGDDDVREAVRTGKLSQAQAREINQVKDEIGRRFALRYAQANGWTAHALKLWREQREISGISQQMHDLQPVLEANSQPSMISKMLCTLDSLYHPIEAIRVWQVCEQCAGTVAAAVEEYQRNHPEPPQPEPPA